jgi:UDP-N-acetylglucosamine enolpyruvyl transferase
MEKLLIKGGNSLHGTINCSGAKNAASADDCSNNSYVQ